MPHIANLRLIHRFPWRLASATLPGVLLSLLLANCVAERAGSPGRPIQVRAVLATRIASCEETSDREDPLIYRDEIVGSLSPGSGTTILVGQGERRMQLTTCDAKCPEGECEEFCTWEYDASGPAEVRIMSLGGGYHLNVVPDVKRSTVNVRHNGCRGSYDPSAMPAWALSQHAGAFVPGLLEQLEQNAVLQTGQTFRLLEGYEDGRQTGTLEVTECGTGVRADPGGPYRVTRGEPVTLDGFGSCGLGLSYEWIFTPRNCPAGAGGELGPSLTGATPTVTLLCSMKATLKVSSGSGSDSKAIDVAVVPRAWKTPFEHVAEEGQLKGTSPKLRRTSAPGAPLEFEGSFVGGENVSASDAARSADNTLEPFAESGTWDGRGYVLAQVGGGPFDGYWYVSEYKLRVKRKTLLNQYLLPGGPPLLGTSFYSKNQELDTDLDGYLTAIRAHEGVADARGVLGHSGLTRKALSARDPAPIVEAMFLNGDRGALLHAVDTRLRETDSYICKQSQDPLPLIWRGKVAFPFDDYTGYDTATVEIGGGNYGHMRACQ